MMGMYLDSFFSHLPAILENTDHLMLSWFSSDNCNLKCERI